VSGTERSTGYGGVILYKIFLKRVYDPADQEDGMRILIDRLWPRGISKEDARLDLWLKDVAPSTELRKAFNHKHELFEEFRTKYLDELRTNEEQSKAVEKITEVASKERVTLLYGAKDPIHNHARVLLEELITRN
jgi:uncharacterized protein YeaO (DUF488 family)